MLELLPETAGNIVALKPSGTLTNADQEAMLPKLQEIFDQQRGLIRLFLDQADLADMEKGVVSQWLWFDMTNRARIERLALLATDAWSDDAARLADIFKSAKVRRFEPSERDDAWAWLNG